MVAERSAEVPREVLCCYINPMLLTVGTLACGTPFIGHHALSLQPLWILGSWIAALAQSVLSVRGYLRNNPLWKHHAASVGWTSAWSCIWVPRVILVLNGQATLGG